MSLKRIAGSAAGQGLLSGLAAGYIRLVSCTGRWQRLGVERPEGWASEGRSFIGAFWHGQLLMMVKSYACMDRTHILISGHRDGQLISRTTSRFGARTVVGSSRRGATGALRQMLRVLRQGEVVAITPDGPRGPRMQAADGAIALARLAGVPVVPVASAAWPRIALSSWDRFQIPLPFARGVFIWGEPITVPSEATAAELEAKRTELEQALCRLTDKADAFVRRGGKSTEGLADAPEGG